MLITAYVVQLGICLSIASLGDEIAARTVTLYGPTKAFNIPGLNISFALASDPTLLQRMTDAAAGLAAGPNRLAQVATLAAYTKGDEWLGQTLNLLDGNRHRLVEFVRERIPSVKVQPPQGTYLAWLDFRDTDLGDEPAKVLVERAKVGLNEGAAFGLGGQGFARLIERPEIMRACVKYGLPRPVLMRFVMKLLSDGFDRRDGDWMDRLITVLSKAVPTS